MVPGTKFLVWQSLPGMPKRLPNDLLLPQSMLRGAGKEAVPSQDATMKAAQEDVLRVGKEAVPSQDADFGRPPLAVTAPCAFLPQRSVLNDE